MVVVVEVAVASGVAFKACKTIQGWLSASGKANETKLSLDCARRVVARLEADLARAEAEGSQKVADLEAQLKGLVFLVASLAHKEKKAAAAAARAAAKAAAAMESLRAELAARDAEVDGLTGEVVALREALAAAEATGVTLTAEVAEAAAREAALAGDLAEKTHEAAGLRAQLAASITLAQRLEAAGGVAAREACAALEAARAEFQTHLAVATEEVDRQARRAAALEEQLADSADALAAARLGSGAVVGALAEAVDAADAENKDIKNEMEELRAEMGAQLEAKTAEAAAALATAAGQTLTISELQTTLAKAQDTEAEAAEAVRRENAAAAAALATAAQEAQRAAAAELAAADKAQQAQRREMEELKAQLKAGEKQRAAAEAAARSALEEVAAAEQAAGEELARIKAAAAAEAAELREQLEAAAAEAAAQRAAADERIAQLEAALAEQRAAGEAVAPQAQLAETTEVPIATETPTTAVDTAVTTEDVAITGTSIGITAETVNAPAPEGAGATEDVGTAPTEGDASVPVLPDAAEAAPVVASLFVRSVAAKGGAGDYQAQAIDEGLRRLEGFSKASAALEAARGPIMACLLEALRLETAAAPGGGAVVVAGSEDDSRLCEVLVGVWEAITGLHACLVGYNASPESAGTAAAGCLLMPEMVLGETLKHALLVQEYVLCFLPGDSLARREAAPRALAWAAGVCGGLGGLAALRGCGWISLGVPLEGLPARIEAAVAGGQPRPEWGLLRFAFPFCPPLPAAPAGEGRVLLGLGLQEVASLEPGLLKTSDELRTQLQAALEPQAQARPEPRPAASLPAVRTKPRGGGTADGPARGTTSKAQQQLQEKPCAEEQPARQPSAEQARLVALLKGSLTADQPRPLSFLEAATKPLGGGGGSTGSTPRGVASAAASVATSAAASANSSPRIGAAYPDGSAGSQNGGGRQNGGGNGGGRGNRRQRSRLGPPART